jgi:hypothetical protein
MTGRRVPWKLAQVHGVSTKMIFTTLLKIWSSLRDRLGGCPFWWTRRWRRSVWMCVRRSRRWSQQIFHHLRQRPHFLWVGRRQGRSWMASPSPRRPPRRSWRGGGWEIALFRKSPSCSSDDMSPARSEWRLLAAIWRKLKKESGLTITIFLLGSSRFKINTLCTYAVELP